MGTHPIFESDFDCLTVSAMSLVNDHVRRQLAEINQLLNERDLVQQVTTQRSQLPTYTPTADHEAALAQFKNKQKHQSDPFSQYGKWECGQGDRRAQYDVQLAELKEATSPTKSDYHTPRYSPPQHQQHLTMLSREEREIESMVAQIEQKQNRLNELEGLMNGLYEKQQMLLKEDEYTTPPMSTTNATIDSDSTNNGDRIERIERLLIHVLKTQERQEETIKQMGQRMHQYELSDHEEDDADADDDDEKAMFRTGMNFVSTTQDTGFVAELLSLLSLVNTDEKREQCLANIQQVIHNHYDDQQSYSGDSEDIVYPQITDVEAVDLDQLDHRQEN